MTEELYDGRVLFTYDDGKHKYAVSKKVGDIWTTPSPVKGITTIINIISKEALVAWSAKLAAYHMRDQLLKHPKANIAALAEEAKAAHMNEKRKSAGVGTVGHKMIESLLLGKEVIMPKREETKKAIENVRTQHEQFEKDFKPETIHVEKKMYSLEHDFAGTDDRFCVIGDKRIVIDYKTSNRSYYNPDGIYGSNFAQLGGQIILLEEQLGEAVDDAWIVNFAKDSTEYKVKRLSEIGLTTIDAKLYFLQCLALDKLNSTFNRRVVQ